MWNRFVICVKKKQSKLYSWKIVANRKSKWDVPKLLKATQRASISLIGGSFVKWLYCCAEIYKLITFENLTIYWKEIWETSKKSNWSFWSWMCSKWGEVKLGCELLSNRRRTKKKLNVAAERVASCEFVSIFLLTLECMERLEM
jgi:hypothetical protein